MPTAAGAAPGQDGNLIRFEVRNGIRRMACTVSNEALEAASGLAIPSTTGTRRQSFDRFRMLINAAALLKLERLPPGFTGPLTLSSKDLRCVPPLAGLPAFGGTGRAA